MNCMCDSQLIPYSARTPSARECWRCVSQLGFENSSLMYDIFLLSHGVIHAVKKVVGYCALR